MTHWRVVKMKIIKSVTVTDCPSCGKDHDVLLNNGSCVDEIFWQINKRMKELETGTQFLSMNKMSNDVKIKYERLVEYLDILNEGI
jgi:hypothetical protein